MAQFIEVTEEESSYSLVVLLNALNETEEEKQKKSADAEDEEDTELEDAKASKLGKLVSGGKYEQLLTEGFFVNTDKLLTAGDELIDSGFSLAFSVYTKVEESARPALVVAFTKLLTNTTHESPLLLLNLLTVLFNMLPTTQRYTVFMAILQSCLTLKRPDLLQGQFEYLSVWGKDWELSGEQLAELYYTASQIVSEDNNKCQACQVEFLQHMEAHKGRKEERVGKVAAAVCLAAINQFRLDAPAFDCNRLASMACVQDLAEGPHKGLLQLMQIFALKRVGDYLDFYKTNADYLKQLGLDHEENMCKLRTTTICSLGLEQEMLSFDLLKEALYLKDTDEVEGAIIDAVVSGRFEAKIDQDKELVMVLRSTKRAFGDKDWALLADKLELWKENVGKVLANLHNIQMPGQEED